MPKVGAFPLMTKYDNERDVVVPDPSPVLASSDLQSDRLCPITYCIRLRQFASSYWIGSLPLPAAALAFPSAGQTSGTSGELPLLPLTRCFAWVPSDIVQQVEHDQLKPEHLVKLRNPESRVSKEPSQPTHLAVGPGGVLVGAEESSDTCTSAFVKTIPNIAALTQI
jgi:hypothetical protein